LSAHGHARANGTATRRDGEMGCYPPLVKFVSRALWKCNGVCGILALLSLALNFYDPAEFLVLQQAGHPILNDDIIVFYMLHQVGCDGLVSLAVCLQPSDRSTLYYDSSSRAGRERWREERLDYAMAYPPLETHYVRAVTFASNNNVYVIPQKQTPPPSPKQQEDQKQSTPDPPPQQQPQQAPPEQKEPEHPDTPPPPQPQPEQESTGGRAATGRAKASERSETRQEQEARRPRPVRPRAASAARTAAR
jgi:hypothetical protein